MSAPERIWATPFDYRLKGGTYCDASDMPLAPNKDAWCYARADLLTAAHAEIARLAAERDAAMAAPAPQAREITVQEAAEVPEVKTLIEAASAMVLHDGWGTVQYTDTSMWGDAEAVQSALRAIAAMRKGG